MELGAFLLLFPWTEYWDHNFFSAMVPEWHYFWGNSYVRGRDQRAGGSELLYRVPGGPAPAQVRQARQARSKAALVE